MTLKQLGQALHTNAAKCGCGSDMVLRTRNYNPNQADLFWGCLNFHDETWPKHDCLDFVWQETAGNMAEALRKMGHKVVSK